MPARGSFGRVLLRYAQPLAKVGRAPIVGPIARWIGNRIVPRNTLTWIQVTQGPAAGIWMRVNPRTGQQVLAGTGELSVQQTIVKHLRPGMTFYDLGANIGFFSLLAARIVGNAGRVVSFEADPEIAARLRENAEHNHFMHVTVEQLAVWSKSGTVTFARIDAGKSTDRGQGHVTSEHSVGELISVEAVALDEYCRTVPAPDFVKCDVEGAEIEVLRGARELLTEKRPVFLCELHSEENRQSFLEEFAALGYRCEDCDAAHVLAVPQ